MHRPAQVTRHDGRPHRPTDRGDSTLRRPLIALAAALAVAIAATACSSGSTTSGSTATTTPAPHAALIGSIASQTGSASPYGAGQLRGQQLALELLAPAAGVAATLANEDDGSTGPGGVAAMEALVDQGASVVLGPTLSPVAAEADPVAQRAGVPVLAVTNTTLDLAAIGDAVWRVSLSESAMIPQAIGAAQTQHGVRTAALVYDATDGYATGAAAAFRQGAAAHGVVLAADQGYNPGASQVFGALEAATASAPDALFLAARSGAAVELLLAAKALALPQVLVGGNGFNAPEVLTGAGPAAEGLIVAASWNVGVANPDNANFVQAYQARYGAPPDSFAAQGYAGIQVALAAMTAGGGAQPGQIQAGLGRIGTVATVLGPLRFEGREAAYPAAIQVVRAGAFQLLAS